MSRETRTENFTFIREAGKLTVYGANGSRFRLWRQENGAVNGDCQADRYGTGDLCNLAFRGDVNRMRCTFKRLARVA